MPTLLILGQVWPQPLSSAAGTRMVSLIDLFLAQQWKIYFACAAEPSGQRCDLQARGVIEVRIAINDSSVDDLFRSWAPDVVMFDRFILEEQFGWRIAETCPQAMRILDTEDLHCLRLARQAAFRRGEDVETCSLVTEVAFREVAAIYRCDLSLMISTAEVEILTRVFHVDPSLLVYCPFLVDNAQMEGTPAFEERRGFAMIGTFLHEPNWQAVLWLKREIWPEVRAQLPQAQLSIYGSYPPQKAFDLHSERDGFLIKGFTPDARAALAKARVCLAPLPFGAGLKGKFVDAMAAGTPSVTTPIGAEGMFWQGRFAGRVARSGAELAAAAVEVHEDGNLWACEQRHGFASLEGLFDPKSIVPAVWQRIATTHANLEAHRRGNFLGAMLSHHQHRSTKYMSLWIEAKNKTTSPAST
jgi:glycosyltransferase involved in cell wall biosynthesis